MQYRKEGGGGGGGGGVGDIIFGDFNFGWFLFLVVINIKSVIQDKTSYLYIPIAKK